MVNLRGFFSEKSCMKFGSRCHISWPLKRRFQDSKGGCECGVGGKNGPTKKSRLQNGWHGDEDVASSSKLSGQIIATSHDRFPPNGGLVREIPLFQGNLGWWNIIIWPAQAFKTFFYPMFATSWPSGRPAHRRSAVPESGVGSLPKQCKCGVSQEVILGSTKKLGFV